MPGFRKAANPLIGRERDGHTIVRLFRFGSEVQWLNSRCLSHRNAEADLNNDHPLSLTFTHGIQILR